MGNMPIGSIWKRIGLPEWKGVLFLMIYINFTLPSMLPVDLFKTGSLFFCIVNKGGE